MPLTFPHPSVKGHRKGGQNKFNIFGIRQKSFRFRGNAIILISPYKNLDPLSFIFSIHFWWSWSRSHRHREDCTWSFLFFFPVGSCLLKYKCVNVMYISRQTKPYSQLKLKNTYCFQRNWPSQNEFVQESCPLPTGKWDQTKIWRKENRGFFF